MIHKNNQRFLNVNRIVMSLALIFFSTAVSYAQELPDDPSFRERKAKEGYTLNLKELIDKSKKKIEQVEDKLQEQAKDRRNQQRETKAREYYEKAVRLFEEGEFDKAKELWEKAIRITEHDEMENYVNKSIRRQRKAEKALQKEENRRIKRLEIERGYTAKEVNSKYKKAVKLFKGKKYLEAKTVFEEVDKMFPGHRATSSYIALIDRKIDEEQEGIIDSKLKDNAFADSKSKARWKKKLIQEENRRQKELNNQADAIYKEAVSLYRKKQYEKAKEKFKEVEWILPNFKKTIKYLSRIDDDIAKYGVKFTEADKIKYFKKQIKQNKNGGNEDERLASYQNIKDNSDIRRKKEEAEFVYDSAVTLFNKKYYAQALEKFNEVESIYPHFKKTDKYIKKLRKKVPDAKKQLAATQKNTDEKYERLYQPTPGANDAVKKAIDDRRKGILSQAEEKYQQAIAFYNTDDFTEAQRKFIAVESIIPGYKATREYLSHINEDISGYGVDSTSPKSYVKKEKDAKKKLNQEAAHNKESKKRAQKKSDSLKQEKKKNSRILKDKYATAKRMYKKKNYAKAKELFNELNGLQPGYKSTLKYISKINKTLEVERNKRYEYQQKQAQAKSVDDNIVESQKAAYTPPKIDADQYSYDERKLIAEGQNKIKKFEDMQFEAEKFKPADPKPDAVFSELEDSEGTAEFFDESDPIVRKDKRMLKKQQRKIKREVIKDNKKSMKRLGYVIDETYDEAKKLFRQKRYAAAKAKFKTVERLYPDYKRTETYINRIDKEIDIEKNRGIARKIEKLYKEDRLLKAKDDGRAAAQATVEEADRRYRPMSERKFNKSIDKEQRTAEEEDRLARMERMQRLEEQKLSELEERVAFRREKDKEQKEIDRQRKRNDRERKRQAKLAEREKKQEIRKAAKERQRLKKQYIKDLDFIKTEALNLLKNEETTKSKNLLYKYESLLIQGDFTEGERMQRRNELSKEKRAIEDELDRKRQEEERVASGQVIKTEKDQIKLRIKRDRELEELEIRIKEEERKLQKERRKELERLANRVTGQDVMTISPKDDKKEKSKKYSSSQKKSLQASAEEISKKELLKFAKISQKQLVEQQREEDRILDNVLKDGSKLEKQKKREIDRLVKARQKELKNKRLSIKKKLNKKLNKLYKEAVKQHKKGDLEQSERLFMEIQELSPGFKKTEKYILKIQNQHMTKMEAKEKDILYARPAIKQKSNRMDAIKSALDSFEEKMW